MKPAKKPKTLHIKESRLWGTVLRIGDTVVQFQEKCRKHGRRAKVVSQRHKPRHKAVVRTARLDSGSGIR